ncbi:PspC domain-containing protein [Promicromonospora sp. NPDC090134]|uniref:PspC domain-containing protein n=1 Tax=Promicromonospora sp. NPDC090134 TaxID=3364408 RepID=UPI0037F3AACE
MNQRLTLRRPGKAGPGHSGRWLAGVAAGLAAHTGLPVWLVRLAFVVLSGFAGAGVVAYVFWWVTIPAGVPTVPVAAVPTDRARLAPRLTTDADADAGAQERNAASLAERMRLSGPVSRLAARDIWLGVALLSGAALLVAYRAGWDPVASWVLPALIGLGGVALAWSQIDVTDRDRWVGGSGTGSLLRSRTALLRLAGGVVLTMLGVLMLVGQDTPVTVLMQATVASVAMVAGLVLVSVPWWIRLVRQLGDERAARARESERADIAAHLHDSVLQTLALIRAQANDPEAVARMARAQERELRGWLYDDRQEPGTSVAAELKDLVAEIEDAVAPLTVETVIVGDCPPTECTAALLQAAREAMLNAFKHGKPPVSVYLEVTDSVAEVFVRDRGDGFDLDEIAVDRFGVRESILGRVRRRGGTAEVVSREGWGTEVRLRMPLEKPANGDRRPANGDRKPGNGDRKPANGDRKPAGGEKKTEKNGRTRAETAPDAVPTTAEGATR